MKEGDNEIVDYDGESELTYAGADGVITRFNFQCLDLATGEPTVLEANRSVGVALLRMMIEPPPVNSWWRRLLRLPRPEKPPLKIRIKRCDCNRVNFPKFCVGRI